MTRQHYTAPSGGRNGHTRSRSRMNWIEAWNHDAGIVSCRNILLTVIILFVCLWKVPTWTKRFSSLFEVTHHCLWVTAADCSWRRCFYVYTGGTNLSRSLSPSPCYTEVDRPRVSWLQMNNSPPGPFRSLLGWSRRARWYFSPSKPPFCVISVRMWGEVRAYVVLNQPRGEM